MASKSGQIIGHVKHGASVRCSEDKCSGTGSTLFNKYYSRKASDNLLFKDYDNRQSSEKTSFW